MEKFEMGGGKPPEQERNQFIVAIAERAKGASPKIQQRMEEILIPNLELMGKLAQRWLGGLQNDFYTLVENPNDPCGGGAYEGWTAKELRELYAVLFGEEMDEF